MKVFALLALSAGALLASASVQAHSHPRLPKELHGHLAAAFTHHEVATLPPGPLPTLASEVQPFVLPSAKLVEQLVAADSLHVPGSVPLVAGEVAPVPTPPPSRKR